MADDAAQTELHEDIVALLSDFRDGSLAESERERVKGHLAGCEACRAEFAELEATLAALEGIKGKKEGAPPELTSKVTETIHRRSAGRFFGRRTLGDRVPFGLLMIVALLVLGVTAGLLWSSSTGSLRARGSHAAPASGSGQVAPTP